MLVDGIRTGYLEAGHGPTVVLLHSGEFGASADLCWEANLEALATDFRVVAPDWLGFGGTDKIRDFVSGAERMMRHMVLFLETMAIDEASFVGCSMGATMLLKEASAPRCRLPIVRMVICSGGGFVPDNEYRRHLLDFDGTREGMRRIVAACFEDPAWAADDRYVKRRLAASLLPGAWEAVAAARLKAPNVAPRAAFGHEDATEYERVSVPTLIVAGERDKLRLPDYARQLGDRIRDATVVTIPAAGHLVNIEQAAQFNRVVSEFLRTGALSAGTTESCDALGTGVSR